MKSVYDRIVNTADSERLLEVEALTNPRVREEAGNFRKIRQADFVTGPGTTPIMASFAYSGPSRFCDGTYGVYYAAIDEDTAIEESRFHTERFLNETKQPGIDVDKRIYTADIIGDYNDIRSRKPTSKLYDPDPRNYGYAQRYASHLYQANKVDGIVYNSVRRTSGQCIVAFRPRLISNARIAKYLQFRWDGVRIESIVQVTEIRIPIAPFTGLRLTFNVK